LDAGLNCLGSCMSIIERATRILRQGGLVGFPTETVYGLGADATRAGAVEAIFTAKGRPSTNPLIVHVADISVAKRYTPAWTPLAQQLAECFWPGPLTLVLPKADVICAQVTAGRATVGLRVPNHPLALELLRAFDGPVAAPSANRANHISPTTAEHVHAELGDRVALILDGGPCAVGIESTVLDLAGERPRILRPGGVSRSQIESVIGPVGLFEGAVDSQTAATSPGQHARHYSPTSPAFRFDRSARHQFSNRPGCVAMVIGPVQVSSPAMVVMPSDAKAYAAVLYQTLRGLDATGPTGLYIEMPPDTPQWTAVRDRLIRATLPV
jgi:L-threonylcarbamoyladenylate synthase